MLGRAGERVMDARARGACTGTHGVGDGVLSMAVEERTEATHPAAGCTPVEVKVQVREACEARPIDGVGVREYFYADCADMEALYTFSCGFFSDWLL